MLLAVVLMLMRMWKRRARRSEAEQPANKFAPVLFTVPLPASTAWALLKYAAEEGARPETVLREALRAYLGEAA